MDPTNLRVARGAKAGYLSGKGGKKSRLRCQERLQHLGAKWEKILAFY